MVIVRKPLWKAKLTLYQTCYSIGFLRMAFLVGGFGDNWLFSVVSVVPKFTFKDF